MTIKLRFAPSPTGSLHVGGLRTALYNYLFAQKHGGKLILRIEDTDQKRKFFGATEKLIESLKWAGIEFDEGPTSPKTDLSAQSGPYIQSARLEIYQKYVQELIDKHHAYYCFCSVDEMKKMRESQIKNRQIPGYDRRCRKLSFDEVDKRLLNKESYVVRLKIKQVQRKFIFHDLVRGEVGIDSKQIDDQVLLKSDGYPTYHLANVIDDHLMGVTHVIRGEEWLSSVPKHILLYEYLGWSLPKFAHLPLLLNEDRSKLSKRQNDVAVEDYIKCGYLQEGLLNFLALLGWSSSDDREIYTIDELKEVFDIDSVNKSGAIFDVQKLDWVNQQHIQKLSLSKLDELANDFYSAELKELTISQRKFILNIIKPSLSRLDQIPLKAKAFLAHGSPSGDCGEIIKNELAQKVIRAFNDIIQKQTDIDATKFSQLVKDVSKSTKLKGKHLYKPLRIAITNLDQGPELPSIVEYYGIDFLKEKLAGAVLDYE
ncbi:MAG: glutamate--tRNA ligase [SAR324 cluster bacterium]|nr:glutamate--tRNA ligase [SAR324 cluster bacterium]